MVHCISYCVLTDYLPTHYQIACVCSSFFSCVTETWPGKDRPLVASMRHCALTSLLTGCRWVGAFRVSWARTWATTRWWRRCSRCTCASCRSPNQRRPSSRCLPPWGPSSTRWDQCSCIRTTRGSDSARLHIKIHTATRCQLNMNTILNKTYQEK